VIPLRFEHVVAGELHHQVTGEPIRALHDDGPCAVRQQGGEHFGKAGAIGDRTRAADGLIVELSDDVEAGRLGVRLDRRALPLVAVLVRPNVRPCSMSEGRRRPSAFPWSLS